MNLSFENKVALVTGAGSGMGLATAKAFAEAGAAVVLADIDENAVRSAAEELVSAGHKAIAVRCNVADEAEVAALIEQTVSTFGRLDAAYNNAGVQSPAVETADASGEDFDRVHAINLRGVWNCMKYELRQMREQGSGAIVNCSSIGGLIGLPGRAIYHASKHGVIGLTRSAALEYASRGIRINAVCPGAIETPMVADMMAKESITMEDMVRDQPIGRLGRPEEIAAAVLWHRADHPAQADGPRVLRHGGGGRQRGQEHQAWTVRCWVVLRLRQHLPELPVRLPVVLHAPGGRWRGAVACVARAAGGRHTGGYAERPLERFDPEPTDDFRCFGDRLVRDRKSTRLNSSHTVISYAVFCLKKKNNSIDKQLSRAATAFCALLETINEKELH